MKQLFKSISFAFAFSICVLLGTASVFAATESESNNDNLSANQITNGDAMVGSLTNYDDVDWFYFDLTGRGYYQVSLQLDASQNTNGIGRGFNFNLYDANFTEINYAEAITNYDGKSTAKIAINPGRYYVKVKMNDKWSPCDGKKYSLKFTSTQDLSWELENNGTNSSANLISTNATYKGATHNSSDVDWYKFEVTKEGYVQVNLKLDGDMTSSNPIGYGWDLYIYNSNDLTNSIKDYSRVNTYDGVTTPRLGLSKGTYYVKVAMDDRYAPCNDTVYNIRVNEVADANWETEKNDTNYYANVIKAGTTMSGLLYSKKDVDWYSFDVTKKGYFNVTLTNSPENSIDNMGSGWNIAIYMAADTTSPIVSYYGIKSTMTTVNLPYATGKYYIKISMNDTYSPVTNQVYSFKVNEYSSAVWESENNDSAQKASTLKLNTSVFGYSRTNEDQDYYKINVPASGKLTISLKNKDEMPSGRGWYVRLYKSTDWGSKLISLENVSNEKKDSLSLAKGTYYIIVSPADKYSAPGTVTYTLTTKYEYSTVSGVKVSNKNSTTNKLSWTKDANVTGYEIWRSTKKTSGFSKIATISKNSTVSYEDKSLKTGTKYYYQIRKYGKVDGKTVYSPYVLKELQAAPAQMKVKSVTAASKAFTVKWDKVSDATGYEVQYSKKSNFSGATIKTVGKNSTVSLKASGSAKTKYYVRIRAYKTVNGKKIYGNWSSAVTVTTK